jgi:hypothetical protein
VRLGTLVAVSALLTACHADVTFRFDVHGNGSALASTREVLDDQLYRLALSQNTDGDPFGTERLQRNGWAVARTSDASGNHVILISKLLTRAELNPAGDTTPLRGAPLPFRSLVITRSPSVLVEQDSLSATIPALLPWAQYVLNKPYAGLASAMISSVVALHLELRTPGRILGTNGEVAPTRFVRWDLALESPTTIRYTVRIIRFDRIVGMVLIILTTVSMLLLIRGRRRTRCRDAC